MKSQTSFLLSCLFLDFVSPFVIHGDILKNKFVPPSSSSRYTSTNDHLSTSLDLEPLMATIARYTATKRGRDALLLLFRPAEPSNKSLLVSPTTSKRKSILSNLSPIQGPARDGAQYRRGDTEKIIKISNSLEEVQTEHQFVSSAMSILSDQKKRQSTQSDDTTPLPLPPIYIDGASPWDIGDFADSDDDDWLVSLLSGQSAQDLNFENIMQAEQNVKRILATYQWSHLHHMRDHYSCFASVLKEVDIDALEALYDEIRDKVKIVKGPRSFNDPSGTKSYEFKLNAAVFPSLSILMNKEDHLVKQINEILANLMRNRKYVSQLRGLSRNNPEPYILDGRMVVTAPKDVAKAIGTIRGHSKGNSYCFVEPKEIVQLGNEMESVKEEIKRIENEIKDHLVAILLKNALALNKGLDAVARLDCIFARAAFGLDFQGVIPVVGSEGVIDVKHFCHPVLASRISEDKTVPIDLLVSNRAGESSLIISGPNGGGKSLAMKSFGLCAMMNKLSIPIPQDRSISANNVPPRIDFFEYILTDFGDHQNILSGESTYMSTLNILARILQKVKESTYPKDGDTFPYYLILLDELGGGTDPESGAFIAQAILEEILNNSRTRTVVTTHSNILKALPFSDDRFNTASVLLRPAESSDKIQYPTFKLCYGVSGNSYALSAASRVNPPLPDDVMNRAASLMSSAKDNSGEYIRRTTEALDREKDSLSFQLKLAEEYKHDMLRCRDALYLLSRSYLQQFSNMENRLNMMIKQMKDKEDQYTLVGDSLATLRLIKEKTKSREEMLKSKGMRMVTMSDTFRGGEPVTIIEGDWKGEMGTISTSQDGATFDEIIVELESVLSLSESNVRTAKLKRSHLAIWDYPIDEAEWNYELHGSSFQNVPMARNNLMSVLNNLHNDLQLSKTAETKFKRDSNAESNFTSSRQRKSAKKKSKSKK